VSRVLALALIATACASDNEVRLQRKELRTNQNTYDAGITAVGDRTTFPVILQSVGPGPVTIYDIQSSDPEHFVVLPSWKTSDNNDDGVADSLSIPRGSEEAPAQAVVQINFRPDADQFYRTRLTIISNDSTSSERTEDGDAVWRAAVRGVGKTPCAEVFPPFYDYGERPAGGYFSADITIRNCGDAPLTVSSFDFEGSSSFFSATATPIYILADGSGSAQIAWIPATSQPETVDVTLKINDPNFDQAITFIGNSCEDSLDPAWDSDDDGWTSCGGDCDDEDPDINPSADESENGIDDNCNGEVDELNFDDEDDDGDGYSEDAGDCCDVDASIHPAATEIPNQIDDDCDNRIDENTVNSDDDEDGWSEREGDCDDTQYAVNPAVIESDNGIDDDCDGDVDENTLSFDDDEDGYTEQQGDCNDSDPWTWPDAAEDCDGVDNDCDGILDEGEDGVEDGACAFVVEREEQQVVVEEGCSALGLGGSLQLLWLPLAAAMRRREEGVEG
jgi:hypothetical protein